MRNRHKKKRRNKRNPPPPASPQLSFIWYTEEQMFELFGLSKGMLRGWKALALPYSQPTGRPYFNQTDVQNFMIKKRRIDGEGA